MSDTSLLELCSQIRRDTIRILTSVDDECLLFAPSGTSNHVIWHAGHAVWLQDVLCLQLLGCESRLPSGWADIYGMNCEPVGERRVWPVRNEMADRLTSQFEELQRVIANATEDELRRVADPSRGPLTVLSRIIHGFHDEARHAGEMCLLAKLHRVQVAD